ncbi:unnamed protein product [Rotaria magnacalcarata]|uniref:Uncharacterized protein n=1 Tax=Rotaria magnacalcarata TaxID=392030 RepID=A0A816MBP0_9BILA|nr:unnamed protein product [Rotaria magnacalcarata]
MNVAVALQIENFYTSVSPTPMSSVPIQFLFYGYTAPSGCSTPPSIISIYQIIASGIPTADEGGPQALCAGATDHMTTYVQGTGSPIGTIFANQTTVYIEATNTVNHPSRNSTRVNFNDAATNTSVYTIDCGHDSNAIYSGSTIVFYIPYPPWIVGHSYYVIFDSGVASGTDFCKPESSSTTDPTFWTFGIWDPGVSSTTARPPTTGTITSRTFVNYYC